MRFFTMLTLAVLLSGCSETAPATDDEPDNTPAEVPEVTVPKNFTRAQTMMVWVAGTAPYASVPVHTFTTDIAINATIVASWDHQGVDVGVVLYGPSGEMVASPTSSTSAKLESLLAPGEYEVRARAKAAVADEMVITGTFMR